MTNNRGRSTRGAVRGVTRNCRTDDQCARTNPRFPFCVNFQCSSSPLGSVIGIPDGNGCPGGYDTCSDGTCSQGCGGCCTNQTTPDGCASVTLNTSPPNNCSGYCWWDDEEGTGCNWQQRTGGRINNNRRNQMRRGGRTRPAPRGRGRKMARGGRARGRRFQGGGTPYTGSCQGGTGAENLCPQFTTQADCENLDISYPFCYWVSPKHLPKPKRKMARGGRTRPAARGRGRQMARGGRPAPRRMARGGRAVSRGRRLQTGGPGGQCPAGTDRTADGRCTPMGS